MQTRKNISEHAHEDLALAVYRDALGILYERYGDNIHLSVGDKVIFRKAIIDEWNLGVAQKIFSQPIDFLFNAFVDRFVRDYLREPTRHEVIDIQQSIISHSLYDVARAFSKLCERLQHLASHEPVQWRAVLAGHIEIAEMTSSQNPVIDPKYGVTILRNAQKLADYYHISQSELDEALLALSRKG